MKQLSLVKSLAHLKEEQKLSEEVQLEPVGLSLTRGTVIEIIGSASSGRTSILLNLISKLTQEGEVCAVVDSANSFDPRSAVLASVVLENLLWVRCDSELENAFTAADYLVQAKGFGLIWLNLIGLSRQKLRMVPRTYWYRYRNRIKETPTLFVVTAEDPVAGSASQQSFALERKGTTWSGIGRFKLLRELDVIWRSRRDFFGPPVRTKVEFDYSDV
jgi:KaiC/GvpD/RAD55 family RecA-like ATPase